MLDEREETASVRLITRSRGGCACNPLSSALYRFNLLMDELDVAFVGESSTMIPSKFSRGCNSLCFALFRLNLLLMIGVHIAFVDESSSIITSVLSKFLLDRFNLLLDEL